MSATPPGWYDDGHGAQRWWDGTRWTEHVQPPAPEPAAAPAAQAPAAPAPAPAAEASAAPAPVASGYPAGYPGQPGAAPVTGPDAPKQRSKLWILWVVLGGVVVVFAVLAAILIPMFIGWFTSAVEPSAPEPQRSSSPGPSVDIGEEGDGAAAAAAVELYDAAWDDGDCDAFEESTTAAYREAIEITDCAVFHDESAYFVGTTDEYELTVIEVETVEGGAVEVLTRETFLLLVDDEGAPLPEPERVAEVYRYVIVEDGGAWRIDEIGAGE